MGGGILAAVLYARLDVSVGGASPAVRREATRRCTTMICDVATHWGVDFVKRLDGGVLLTFGRCSDAIEAAVAVEQRLQRDLRRHPEAPVGVPSIGLGVGEITEVNDDIAGLPVVEAARLAQHAAPGEILSTAVFRELTHPADGIDFHEREPTRLKGFGTDTIPLAVDWQVHPELAETIALPRSLRSDAPFVGRRHPLAELERELDPRTSRSPRLAVITGPAGVGKSALAGRVAESFRRRGGLVLAGRSPREAVFPYRPIREALDDLTERHPRRAGVVAGHRDALLPVLDPRSVADDRSDLDSPTRLTRLHGVMADLLHQLGDQLPVLLVLDDVQWLDPASTHLVGALFDLLVDTPITLLLAARSDELGDRSGARSLIGRLARDVPTFEVRLDGLDVDEIAELITATGAGSDGDSAELHRRTGGNPFLALELMAELAREATISRRAEMYVTSRLDRLRPETIDVLRVAALDGRTFDPALVADAIELDDDEVFDLLEDALSTGILREQGPGLTLAFDHDLIRERLLEDMSGLQTARIHRRLALALERNHGPLPDLARHFAGAAPLGDRTAACKYQLLAGEEALTLDANELASELFAAAYDFADGDAGRIAADIGSGRSRRRLGDPAARALLHRAADAAAAMGDGHTMGEALLADYRGTFGIAFAVDQDRVDRLRRALELLGDEPTPMRARLLASLAVELVWADDWAESIELADLALEVAEGLDDDVRADVLALRQWVIYHPTDVRLSECRALDALVDADLQPQRSFEVAGHAFFTHLRIADRELADASIELASWLSERLDQPFTEWMLSQRRACLGMVRADFEDARRWIDRAAVLSEATKQPDGKLMFAVQMFWLHYETAHLDDQTAELRGAVATIDYWPPLSWPAVGFRCLEAGLVDEAAIVHDKIRQRDIELPRDQIWLWNTCQLVPITAHFDRAELPVLLDVLSLHRDEIANMVFSTVGPVARYLGIIHAALGDHDEAISSHRRALDTCDRFGAPSWAARARLDLADALTATGRGDEAESHRRRALSTAERLGLPLVAHRAAEALAAASAAQRPPA